MNTICRYKDLIERSFLLSEQYLLQTSHEQIEKEKKTLFTDLDNDTYIKVPIVGDFSAGKSSLLNCLVGNRNLLPVDITPETAVAYELHYSPNEYLELYRDGLLVESRSFVDEIKQIKTQPGDIIKVYINSSQIKNLEQRKIILVDMPGLDSGIKEHNDAILHYVERGTAFVLLVDIGQGTLRRSTLSFMSELGKYNLKPAVLISKIDKKPITEINDIKEYISFQSNKAIGNGTFVGCISAYDNNVTDFITYLELLDSEKLVVEKFSGRVSSYINTQIISLSTQVDVLNSNIEDVDEKLKQLEKEKLQLTSRFENNYKVDSPQKSTNDILDAVYDELNLQARDIAAMLVEKDDIQKINAQILSYIRPVLINAFRTEGEQYASAMNTVVDEVTYSLQDSLKIDSNLMDDAVETFREEIVGGVFVASEILLVSPNVLARTLGYVLQFIGERVPDLIHWLFGKSRDEAINEAACKIREEVIPQIVSKLKPTIFEQVVLQQERIRESIQTNVKNSIENLEESVRVVEEKTNKEELEKQIITLRTIINQLETLKQAV